MNNSSIIPAFDFRDMVVMSENKVITTSIKVAQYFGKRHKDVLRAIRNLKCSSDFTQRNFAPIDFIDKNGDIQPMYNITRDGCMMLVMGFTGKTATAIKECYINAFNWMAEQLNRRLSIGEEMQHRFAIKETRSKLKGTIGSRLMNERKKEKPILAVEHEHIMKITAPAMLAIMEGKD
ncbi:TPA: Rha family transcriptional regulator [Yersinia enterocolitica]|uniref:Rha family transcriptional regulator n=1 Tax=Yersinia enterocolitica TaxID=630 RepID=UPI002EF506C2|nr:Rha family transcriptional regulator [Yersinia enterocolitica]EKN6164909.1 Rha family transcriptional regulator [Yersinia enterocolitica]HDL8130501.1 Rha family transcriptional regulator [Yersinia enterocolitica]HDL8461973.1 Rha family transcriptional regulator [Yersinia enterocolitica]